MSESAANNAIIVVERDRHVRDLLIEFLEPAGFAVRCFEDGVAALAAVQAKAPALVILEILVPKLDGLGLCRAIKLAPATSEIPVLVLSILSANDRAHLAGADGFMLKPIEQGRLLAAVERLTDRPTRQEAAL